MFYEADDRKRHKKRRIMIMSVYQLVHGEVAYSLKDYELKFLKTLNYASLSSLKLFDLSHYIRHHSVALCSLVTRGASGSNTGCVGERMLRLSMILSPKRKTDRTPVCLCQGTATHKDWIRHYFITVISVYVRTHTEKNFRGIASQTLLLRLQNTSGKVCTLSMRAMK